MSHGARHPQATQLFSLNLCTGYSYTQRPPTYPTLAQPLLSHVFNGGLHHHHRHLLRSDGSALQRQKHLVPHYRVAGLLGPVFAPTPGLLHGMSSSLPREAARLSAPRTRPRSRPRRRCSRRSPWPRSRRTPCWAACRTAHRSRRRRRRRRRRRPPRKPCAQCSEGRRYS